MLSEEGECMMRKVHMCSGVQAMFFCLSGGVHEGTQFTIINKATRLCFMYFLHILYFIYFLKKYFKNLPVNEDQLYSLECQMNIYNDLTVLHDV